MSHIVGSRETPEGVAVKAGRIAGILLVSTVWVCSVASVVFPGNPPVGCRDGMGAPQLLSIATELGQRTGAQRANLGDLGGCSSGLVRPAFIGYSGATLVEVSGRFRSVETCRMASDGRFECEVQGLAVIVVVSSTENGDPGAIVWLA